jgi:hypothetical protein
MQVARKCKKKVFFIKTAFSKTTANKKNPTKQDTI